MQRDMVNLPAAQFTTTVSRPDENHAALLDSVEQYSRERGLPQSLRYRLCLIVDELVMNAIMHGGCTGENHTITVELMDCTNELLMAIIDTGLPFNPTTHARPQGLKEDAQVPIGGVGLCLVKRLADRMEYARIENHNRLNLSLNKTKMEDICS